MKATETELLALLICLRRWGKIAARHQHQVAYEEMLAAWRATGCATTFERFIDNAIDAIASAPKLR